jgi:tight adherence protein B
MSASWWLAGCCVVAAAAVVSLPARGRSARRRLAALNRADPASLNRADPVSRPSLRWPGPHPPPWIVAVACVAVVVGAATAAGGPVAGLAAGAYGGVAARLVFRRRAEQAAARARTRALDALYCLAADLRAGVPATTASIVEDGGRLSWVVDALRRVADQTGAPLADLLERAAADARAADRIGALAAAQAAGAQATAWLLAGLPAGGIALGYAIGADPLRVLLHTPIGAGCTVGAIVLQIAGLAWADRLVRPPASKLGLRPPAPTAGFEARRAR